MALLNASRPTHIDSGLPAFARSRLRSGRGGLPSSMTTTAEHLRNTLDGRWRDVKNTVRAELSTEVFRPHYTPNTVDRPHEGGRAAARSWPPPAPPRTASARSTAATATSAPRSSADRDARDVRPVADGQGRRAVGPVRRRHREPGHRAPPRGLRAAHHRPRPARLLRDDRDRPRQRRAVAGDHRHLRPGDRRVRDQLPDSDVAQGLHRRCGRNSPGGSGFRAADHRRRERTACTASWCRSATTTATTCPA